MKKVIFGILLTIVFIILLFLLVKSDMFLIRSEHVRIASGAVTLDAVLALPRWKGGPYPAAVIVHGSGRTAKRDLQGYARLLVPHGLAVLMFDKRGVGDSTGKYQQVQIADSELLLGRLADDVLAAVTFLSTHTDIDAERIGLIGSSQAGWIMPLASSRSDRVAFIVCISGPAVTYGQEMFYSQLTGDDPGPYNNLSPTEIERLFAAYDGPRGYDPSPTLNALRIPSLWILGGRDRSVPTASSVTNLELLERNHPGLFTIRVYPNCDHNICDADTGRRIDIWPEVREWLRAKKFLRR